METHKNAFLVGLFVIAVVAAALGFTLWLTAAGRGETMRYRIYFAESVGGLKIGSAVKFQGVDVGTVENMSIDAAHPGRVRVEADILKSAPVRTGTTAMLKLQGLTGDIYIDLSGGTPSEPMLAAASKGEIPEIRSMPSTINTLMTRLPEIEEKLDKLLATANRIAGQIDKVFSDQNVKTINGVVHTLGAHYGGSDTEDK